MRRFIKNCLRSAWLVSVVAAGVAEAASPGTALRFDGTNAYLQIASQPNLNAFPLTVTAWFRTTNADPARVQGLVSKYAVAQHSGWGLTLIQGQVHGVYARDLNNVAVDLIASPFVADGFWHHAALVVDQQGGRIYVDGVLVGSSGWTGTSGAPATAEPIQMGRYSTAANRLVGDIDEVTLWHRALGLAELNYLKHRELAGTEDGLLGLWHLDEGTGALAQDATPHGYDASIVGTPNWVASTAPLVFRQIAGSALVSDGSGGALSVPDSPALDSFPLTVMAWVRTGRNAPAIDGIVSKYAQSSLNGYSLFVFNGHLRAWFFRDAGDYIWDGPLGLDGGAIADNQWHHVALVVSLGGGRLFVDGVQTGTMNWTGNPGPPTSAEPLQIGRYWTYSNSFQGLIDEVSIWRQALSAAQINAYLNAAQSGNEPGLEALWHLNEGYGPTAGDTTGNGHDATLQNGAWWSGSTAFLGDGTSVIQATPVVPSWSRVFALTSNSALRGFTATEPVWIRRLDDFGASGGVRNVVLSLTPALTSQNQAGLVPLNSGSVPINAALSPYNAAAAQPTAGGSRSVAVVGVEPGTQLDSVNDRFTLGLSAALTVDGGPPTQGETATTDFTPLLHFDGTLYFGAFPTTFSALANTPARGNLAGGGVATALAVAANSGVLAANPAYHYGTGALLNVTLMPNGDAMAVPGSAVALSGSDSECLQNICFSRTNLTLDTSALRGTVKVQLPVGFSVCTNFSSDNRLTVGGITVPSVALDNSLHPTDHPVALLNTANFFYGALETLPCWIRASVLDWTPATGQIVIANPSRVIFVREEEDDALAAAGAAVTEPNAVNRVSNDGYYRGAGLADGTGMTITADANGVARLTGSISLNPPELRPHFPYSGFAPGAQIPTLPGGQIAWQDGLVDTTNSALVLAGPVPVSYARDCLDTNCPAAATTPAQLAFTAVNNQFAFTPDGGLLAYGSVPPAGLTWGYAGNGQFAQQTSDVEPGACHIPGTFLRADQTSLPDAQRAAGMLLSGFGDEVNPAYVERPLQGSYGAGFANYAGLNFRAPGSFPTPASGRSLVAKQDSGWYPLTPRSKYYVRYGGVSGIHEAASFPTDLPLYGYHFTFTTYRLSYLDSVNVESRTDGALVLPGPAGFQQEFLDMKFVCKGDLDSARVPPDSTAKPLTYWGVSILPQTIEFRGLADDVCGTSDRVLALGVETKLPFIPQALHAVLGFHANGNLVVPAERYEGLTSRFPVPGHLTLQGPGGSTYSFDTVGEGYFNNWDVTPAERPPSGFYSLPGLLRVPFFEALRVQLHITPTSGGNDSVDIMGGWPAPNGTGENFGWEDASGDYFSNKTFDPINRAWPADVSLGDYRQSPISKYHPRAHRNWIQVATFDYPLHWQPLLREFSSWQDSLATLPIIDVTNRLHELSPGKVDLDFAEDLRVQLPRIKVLDFVNDAVAELNGPINTLSNAIRQELESTLDSSGLASGFRGLQNVLREDASAFFRPVLQPALGPVADGLTAKLATVSQTNPAAFLATAYGLITDRNNGLGDAFQAIEGGAGQADTVLGQLNQVLADVDNSISLIERVLEKDGGGQRHVVRVLIKKLAQDQGPALGLVGNLGDDLVSGVLSDLEPTMERIEAELREVHARFNEVRAGITGGGGVVQVLDSVGADTTVLQQVTAAAGASATNYLATVLNSAGDYFTANPPAASAALRERFTLAFLGSALPASYQRTFKQFLADDNFLLDQLMDVLFDQINNSLRNLLEDQLGSSTDGVMQALKGVQRMQQSLLAAKIRGSPTFEGDSLRRIHLTGDIQLNLPDPMNFTAYMDIKELTSQSTPLACIPEGGSAAEVTLGAKDVPLKWPGQSGDSALYLTAEARWTLRDGAVIGFGGQLDLTGGAGFMGCGLKDIGATLALGSEDNYFAARAAGTVVIYTIPVDVQAGIFVGHCCSVDTLKFVDPEAAQVLGDPAGFTGIYVQFGGGVSLSKILLGVSTCLIDAEVGISSAVYYSGGFQSGTLGFRQKDSLDFSLLCLLSGHADLAMGASATYRPPLGYQVDLVGSADACVKLGSCPFCLKLCGGLTIRGSVKNGGIDYSLEY